MAESAPRPWTWYLTPRPLFSGNNHVALLRGATELLPALCAAIHGARHEVWLASYILHHDPQVLTVVQALEGAARRGVRVRIVVDGFGSKQSMTTLEPRLSAAGVAVGLFRPIDRWTHWFQPSQLRRMHMKVAVIDSEEGFIGGINLIDDHLDLNHGPSHAPRLDFAVAVRGPVVASMEQAVRAMWLRAWFGQDWREELRELMRGANRLQQIQALIGQMRLTGWRRPSDGHLLAPVRAALVVRDNLRQRRTIERTYVEVLRSARQRIWLVSPYFFPGREFRKVICDAARRGVDVRLLLQGKLDYRLAGWAAKVLYDELLHAGVKIFEYTPAFLHAKVALVDDDWATVGSSNIDPLSLLLNLEANLIVSDTVFNARLAAELHLAHAASHPVNPAEQLTHHWLGRLRNGLGRALVTWIASIYLRIAGAQPSRRKRSS
ncbi:cardiolipin synthase ClsB [Leptothrix ochracea]|uniref:cardiolipin synthase ClsB n=1 Tax=Leptothrix ochracea TaxID=735331 RepID=UPI0034E2ED3D